MPNAQANLVSTLYITEVTQGTTPSSALTYLRVKNPDFTAGINTTVSQELRSDRAITDLVRTSGTSTGNVGFELSAVEYEPFMESALGGAWSTAVSLSKTTISAASADNSYNDSGAGFSTTNIKPGCYLRIGGFVNTANNGIVKVVSVTTTKIVVSGTTLVTEAAGPTVTVKGKFLRNGVTKKSFTFERQFTDLTNVFMNHKGMMVNQMTLNTSSGAIIEGSFTFNGMTSAVATATVGTGGPTAATTNSIMSATANVGMIYENATPVTGIYFKSINLTTNNNLRETSAIGSLYPVGVNMGTFDAEFAVEAYFSNSTLINKFLGGTLTELAYILTDDSGNSYVIDAPQVKYSAGNVSGVTLNSDVMQSLTGKALLDPVLGYMLQICYLPA